MKRGRRKPSITGDGAPAQGLAERIPQWQPMLRAQIRRTVLDSHAVDDILQNVMLQALRAVKQLRDPRKLSGWLRVIARNAVREWLRGKRDHRWSELAEEAAAAPPEQRDELFGAIDEIARHVAALQLPARHDIVLVLRHAMNWSPAEVGALLGMPATQVSQILQKAGRVKPTMESSDEQESREAICKARIATTLFRAAHVPVSGNRHINRGLMQETHAWIRLAAMQHSGHPAVLGAAAWICFMMGRLAHRDENRTTFQFMRDWDRREWNWELMDEGAAYYRRMMACNPDNFSRLYMEEHFLVFYARRHEDVPFARALDLSSRILEQWPREDYYISHALILLEVDGPLAASKFLHHRRNIAGLKNNPLFYYVLGRLYYESKQWKKARTELNRFLRSRLNDALQQTVRDWLAHCESQLSGDTRLPRDPSRRRKARSK